MFNAQRNVIVNLSLNLLEVFTDYIIKPNKDRLWSSLFVEAGIAGT